jgi:hypothetical protein
MVLSCMVLVAKAQTYPLSKWKVYPGMEYAEIMRLGERYQSFDNMRYDLVITRADSAAPTTILETINAFFEIAGKKSHGIIDSVELIQGEDYNLTIFQRNQLMMVENKKKYNNALQAPVLDTLFFRANVDSMYFTNVSGDSIKIIHFRFNAQAPYEWYKLRYNANTLLIQNIAICLKKTGDATPPPGQNGKNIITYTFQNYQAGAASKALMDETQSVRRNVDGSFVSRGAYTGYQVIDGTR